MYFYSLFFLVFIYLFLGITGFKVHLSPLFQLSVKSLTKPPSSSSGTFCGDTEAESVCHSSQRLTKPYRIHTHIYNSKTTNDNNDKKT